MYNKEAYQALPRMIRLSEREFAIVFPHDIGFEIYCYFINYLVYPMELKWKPDVIAWATTKPGEELISSCALFSSSRRNTWPIRR
jgi:hypothetical protein